MRRLFAWVGPPIRQSLANLRLRLGSAALIALALGASTVLLGIALAASNGAPEAYDRLWARSGEPVAYFYVDDRSANPIDLAAFLADQDDVESVGTPEPEMYLEALPGTSDAFSPFLFRDWPDTDVATPVLVSGRPPDRFRPGVDAPLEISIDHNVALGIGIGPGDPLELPTGGVDIGLEIVGTHVTSERCPFPFCETTLYFGRGTISRLAPPGGLTRHAIPFRITDADPSGGTDTARVDALVAKMAEAFGEGAIEEVETATETRANVSLAFIQWAVTLSIFSVISAIVAIFLIAVTVGSAVRGDARRIGLLRSVGYTSGQIRIVYISEQVVIAGVAGIVGGLVSQLVGPTVLAQVREPFAVPPGQPALAPLLIAGSATVIAAVIATLFPLRRATRVTAVSAIREGAEKPRRIGGGIRGPVVLARATGDLLGRPVRTMMTVASLALAVAALTYTQLMTSGIGGLITNPDSSPFGSTDVIASRSPFLSVREAERVLADDEDVIGFRGTAFETFTRFAGEPEQFGTNLDFGGINAESSLALVEGNKIEDDDEVLIGLGLARERTIAAGDVINLEVNGRQFNPTVAGIVRDFNDLGRTVTMRGDTAQRFDRTVEPNQYEVSIAATADADAIADRLAETTDGRFAVQVIDERLLEQFVGPTLRLIGSLSVMLVGVALLGVLVTMTLAVVERRREFALLKAIGMTPRQVIGTVVTSAVMMGVLGFAVGVPLGVAGGRAIINLIADSLGFGALSLPFNVFETLPFFPVLVITAIIGATIPARRAARVSVIEALRFD